MKLEKLLSTEPVSPWDAITAAAAPMRVLHEFVPLEQSLEWRLSRLHWESAGTRPFSQSTVPYVVNNAGWLAELTAPVVIANARRHEGDRVALLELGAGTGLFALQLLQAIGRDAPEVLERIVFYVTDASPLTVQQWQRTGQFAPFARQVRMLRCDADDLSAVPEKRLRAVFANYLLDSLPTAVVRREQGRVEELWARSLLAERDERLVHVFGFDGAEAQRLARSEADGEQARLIDLLPLVEIETEFREARRSLPFVETALELSQGQRTVLNHGALSVLQRCLDRLEPAGMVMINDYGPVTPDQVGEVAYVQRFGLSTATCVNFPLLERQAAERGCRIYVPSGDDHRSIHSRLVMNGDCDVSGRAFVQAFSQQWVAGADESGNAAVEQITAGRYEQALALFKEGIAGRPGDWNLLAQAGEFMVQQLERPAQGLELALAAVRLNPWYSPFVWNTLGNALFRLARHQEAFEAYSKAEAIDPTDAQTQLNLAFAHAHFGAYDRALLAIARGLSTDRNGRFRSHLLEKQGHILQQLSGHWQNLAQRLDRRAVALGKGE